MNSTATKHKAYVSNHIAYESKQGIALKVSYRFAPVGKEKLYLRWMLIISFQDALSVTDGFNEIAMANANRVSALEMRNNAHWDCLLMNKV